MKLKYSKILLFFILLNILVSSPQKNPSIITTHHTATTISRVISEGDTQSSIYDNDADIKSVKENFDRQTSQRFEEYKERVKDKRQKRKEERDKNIQNIIDKDKREKSLEEKIEKGCLRCGCGLGGVAASVGLFGGLGTYGWEMSATAAAIAKVAADAKAAGDAAGVNALIEKLKETFGIEELWGSSLADAVTTENYFDAAIIVDGVKQQYELLCKPLSTCDVYSRPYFYKSMPRDEGTLNVVKGAKMLVEEAVKEATKVTTEFTGTETAVESSHLYSAIGYSVLVILIIVLVMIIIYLFLRYRRKKKMNKKAQYTKLLKE
ncbi:rifin [Plasmodium reichenowi]|uniref:Rifin n=1 Tax=Plasmodium reichenowi TaxID=5854 RepID=A0A151L236_PLARE|nr:rifin [Plasmodium reichenowi]KYN93016.1 rifin [Plasmodium reichenowi]